MTAASFALDVAPARPFAELPQHERAALSTLLCAPLLAITRWRGLTAPKGRREVSTWPALAGLLATPVVVSRQDTAPGWAPATFHGHRCGANVEFVHALGLDLDGGIERDELAAKLGRLRAIVHSTWHHRMVKRDRPAAPRWRAIVALSRPVTAAEYSVAHPALGARLGLEVDRAAADPSRLWFVPCAPRDRLEAFEWFTTDGGPVDVDELLLAVAAEREAAPPPSAPRVRVTAPNGPSVLERASAYLAKMDPAVSGQGGHPTTWRAACAMVRGFDLSPAVALELLTREYNPRCQPPWSRRELEHKVDNASRSKLPAGYLLEDERSNWRAPAEPPEIVAECIACDEDLERAAIQGEAPTKRWTTPAERARRLASSPAARVPLDLPTLDAATRGGLKLSTRLGILGPPGTGKTTLVVEKGVELAQRGIHVAILAADEEGDGLLVRVGQRLGLNRDDLDNGNAAALGMLAEQLERLPTLHLVDADEESATVDSVSERLAELASGTPAVLIVDSLQTAADQEPAREPRARVDAVLAALKRASRRGQLVLVTSEVVRSIYRTKNPAERTADLAAGKESGGIEYSVHVQLVLHEVEGEEGVVDVAVPKNRLGRKTPFRLRQDFARASFVEIPLPDEAQAVAGEDAKLNQSKERVLRCLRRCTGLKSANAVAKAARGKRTYTLAALAELREDGVVVEVDGCFRVAAPVETGGDS